MKYKTLFLCCLILATSACESSELLPATRLSSQGGSGADRELVEQAIAAMLNQNSVIIADDAFIQNSEIIIEQGQPINDRNLETPDHFRLWKRGSRCFLEHVEASQYREIPGLVCSARPEI